MAQLDDYQKEYRKNLSIRTEIDTASLLNYRTFLEGLDSTIRVQASTLEAGRASVRQDEATWLAVQSSRMSLDKAADNRDRENSIATEKKLASETEELVRTRLRGG